MEPITEKNFQAPVATPAVKILKITNFSDEIFTHTWNKVPYTLKPGEYRFMEAGIANHFAKHLINRELLKNGRENDTSPRKPSENPFFMEMYNQCIEELPTDGAMDDTAVQQEVIDRNMKAKEAEKAGKGKGGKPKNEDKKEEEFEEIPVDDDEE